MQEEEEKEEVQDEEEEEEVETRPMLLGRDPQLTCMVALLHACF